MLLLLQLDQLVTSLLWVTSFCNVLCYTQFGLISLIYISPICCVMNKLKLGIRKQRESKMGCRQILSMTLDFKCPVVNEPSLAMFGAGGERT